MKITKNPTTKAIIPELRGNLGAIRYPCFTEIKYDGEATVIMYDITWPDKIITTNKYGTMRSDWSKLDEIAEILESKGIKKCTMLAELFYSDGKAGRLYDLLSNKDNDADLNLMIYDIVHIVNDTEVDGTKTDLLTRKEILNELFKGKGLAVQSKIAYDRSEVDDIFEYATEQGYEGIVVKNFSGNLTTGPCDWAKMKYKDQSDYEIRHISISQERIEVLVPYPAGNSTGKSSYVCVGVKCCNKDKKNLKVGDMVTIEHQGVLPSGSLRHPVYIGKAKEKLCP